MNTFTINKLDRFCGSPVSNTQPVEEDICYDLGCYSSKTGPKCRHRELVQKSKFIKQKVKEKLSTEQKQKYAYIGHVK